MDEITNERFRKVEQKIETEGKRVADDVEARISGKLDNVARGLETVLSTSMEAGFRAASEERRLNHAEQMKRFQSVVDEVRAARDQRMAELEATVARLLARVDELEKALGPRQ